MKPGDALADDKWVVAIADTRCGQACYVFPDRIWRWADQLEPTGAGVLAVDKAVLPLEAQELIRFLIRETDMWPVEIARVTGAKERWIKEVARREGKRYRADDGQRDTGQYKRPKHLGKWWNGNYPKKRKGNGNLQRQDQEG